MNIDKLDVFTLFKRIEGNTITDVNLIDGKVIVTINTFDDDGNKNTSSGYLEVGNAELLPTIKTFKHNVFSTKSNLEIANVLYNKSKVAKDKSYKKWFKSLIRKFI